MADILVLHDQTHVRQSLVDQVRRIDYTPVAAVDVDHARANAGSTAIDYPVIVIGVPDGKRSATVIREVKTEWPIAEVIVLGTSRDIGDATDAIRHGAYEYLAAPVDPSRLRQAIRGASERGQDFKESRRRGAGDLGMDPIHVKRGGTTFNFSDELLESRRHMEEPRPVDVGATDQQRPEFLRASGARLSLAHVHAQPRSCAQRWAALAIRGCDAEGDPKTLSAWATVAGVSHSSLCEACRLVGHRPQHARDFVRALRALIWAFREQCNPEVLLDIGDLRTLRAFVDRAGETFRRKGSIGQFLADQGFLTSEHVSVRLIGDYFARASERARGTQSASAK